jgi:hypothetical protein
MAVLMLILAVFGFGISLGSLGLFFLAIMGAVLTLALRILTAILWVAIKIIEHRSAEPEILIVISEEERPMRDVARWRPTA